MPLALFLFISSLVSAQNGPQVILDKETKPMRNPSFSLDVSVNPTVTRFDLVINNPEKKKLHLQISGSGPGTVVDTVISSTNFNQRYNMEQVEDGQYTITVSNGREKKVKKIELSTVTRRNMELVK